VAGWMSRKSGDRDGSCREMGDVTRCGELSCSDCAEKNSWILWRAHVSYNDKIKICTR